MVNKIREEEGLSKKTWEEEFLKRAWAWKEEYGGRITRQCRKLGTPATGAGNALPWTGVQQGCKTFFIGLYEKGLIYRGNRLINWCPQCKTSLSDAEVEHEDRNRRILVFQVPCRRWRKESW